MCFHQRGDISTLKGGPLKLMDKFTYQGSNVSSTEKDINTRLVKAWTAIDWLSVIWKSNLTNKIKRSFFFQAAVVLILLYGCTTWTLTKRMGKSLTAITQECCEQFWTSPGGNIPKTAAVRPPTTHDKTMPVRRTRHVGHCWINKYGLISHILIHMDEQRQEDQLEQINNSSVPI